MKKILLVIQREYFTRVKKPSFWILTIVVPILIAALYAIPIALSMKPLEKATVVVVDETTLFQHSFQSSKEITYLDAGSLDYAKQQLEEVDSINAILYIPARETTIPNDAFLYYRTHVPSQTIQSDVDRQLQTLLRDNILLDVHHISAEDYAMISNTKMKLHKKDLETGRDGFLEIKMAIGMVLAMIIFMAIFMFGSQVMRGVMEEKTNRIVEVIVSSVRPFQLMMGKVVGIGLVGLTQFLLWVILSAIGLVGIQLANADMFQKVKETQNITQLATKGEDAAAQMQQIEEMANIPDLIEGLMGINYGVILGMFIIFFIFGYLLYATLFAAVGSISDNETDSQQFTLPITIPLILTFLLTVSMVNEPSGTLATWLSIIPFTSPVAMMFRLPFGVPIWQAILSACLLIASFPLCTWVAAKIYRTGILRYGKKITWKELFKWIRSNNA